MNKILFFFLLLSCQFAIAQKYAISGTVIENKGGVLPSATVLLLQPKDSSIISHTTTNSEGIFILGDIEQGNYIFSIRFLGFASHHQNLNINSEYDTLNLGMIKLHPETIELASIVITDTKSILIKEDTIIYDANSFKTRPNANAGQLLRQLPGVIINNNGTIRILGENVARIYVNGKEYFGGNLKMALKNLPAEAIEKIQVIDEKSEEAQFSGVADGRSRKVINVTIKESWLNEGFGKIMAGLGTKERYASQGDYNLIDGKKMLSVSAASNNVNNLELSSEGGNSGGEMLQNGLVKTHSGGINFVNQIAKKIHVNGSYSLELADTRVANNIIRENFLPEGKAIYLEENQQNNRNNIHTANVSLEHKDSANIIRLNTTLNLADDELANMSSRQTYNVDDVLINWGDRTVFAKNNTSNLNSSLFYGRRFRKSGRLFTVKSQLSFAQNETSGHSNAYLNFSEEEEEAEEQLNEQENQDVDFGFRFTFTEPLGKRQLLQANYNFSNQSSDSNLEVYDIINELNQFNPDLSDRFNSGFLVQQAGLTYRLNRKSVNLSMGFNLQQAELSRQVEVQDALESQSFHDILPYLNFSAKISKLSRLTIDYNTSVSPPSVNQLQPVVSRFDPLHLSVGNPDLRPEYNHRATINFNTSDARSGVFLSGSLNFNFIDNPIILAANIEENQVRTSQYVNVNERVSYATFLNVGIPFQKINSQFNVSSYFRNEQNVNLLNGIKGDIKQNTIGGDLVYTYRFKEKVDFSLHTSLMKTRSDYELNHAQKQSFFRSSNLVDATVYFFKNYRFTTELNYSRFRSNSTNFDQGVQILNFYLSRLLLKDNKGEIKFSAINVLGQNVGVNQFTSPNFIEQSTQNVLGNFYMLSFTLNLQNPSD